MIRVLVETEIILNIFQAALGQIYCQCESASELWEMMRSGKFQGYITSYGLNEIRHHFGQQSNELEMLIALEIKKVMEIDRVNLLKYQKFSTFNANSKIELATVRARELDAIVVQKPKDWSNLNTCIYSLDDFLKELRNHQELKEEPKKFKKLSPYIAAVRQIEVDLAAKEFQKSNILRYWLQNIISSDWYAENQLDKILGTEKLSFAFRFYKSRLFLGSLKEIEDLLLKLNNGEDNLDRLQIVRELGQIFVGHQEAIAALEGVLDSDKDSKIRREAAVSLGRISPQHPRSGVKHYKLIDFSANSLKLKLILCITLVRQTEYELSVHLRLTPHPQKLYLAPRLELMVIEGSEKVFQKVVSRDRDNAIQLSFCGDYCDRFAVQIALGNLNVTEEFII